MPKPTGAAFAEAAMKAAEKNPPILYGKEDCQAFVEQSVIRAGGSIKDYRGSNDMFRNACTKVANLNRKHLVPGMVLFIHDFNGGEPDQYKKDGKGNAWHVGIYTGGRYEVVHSSATKGMVHLSTIKNGWTHMGWLKDINYSNKAEGSDGMYIKKGSDPDAVKAVQERLNILGYYLGDWGVDGDFGPITETAVRNFQADNDLPVTGYWTELELAKAKYLIESINDFPPKNTRQEEIIEAIRDLLIELEGLA